MRIFGRVPMTSHPTPYTLNPQPYTVQPTACSLQPTLHTRHPTPLHLRRRLGGGRGGCSKGGACKIQNNLISVSVRTQTPEDPEPEGVWRCDVDVHVHVCPDTISALKVVNARRNRIKELPAKAHLLTEEGRWRRRLR